MPVLPSDRQLRTQAQLIPKKSIFRSLTTPKWSSRPKPKKKAKRANTMKKRKTSMMTRMSITTPSQIPRTNHNLLKLPKLHPKPKKNLKSQLARASFKLQRRLKLSARRTTFLSRRPCKRPRPDSSSSNSKRLRLRKSA